MRRLGLCFAIVVGACAQLRTPADGAPPTDAGLVDCCHNWTLNALDDLDKAEAALDFALRRMPDGWARERIRDFLNE